MTDFLRPLAAACMIALAAPAFAGAYDDILIAASQDQTAKVVELLQRGMDVNTSDRNGDTLAAIAARNGNDELLDFLIRNRANVSKRNKYGDSPIMLATMQGHPATVRRLLEAGADIHGSGWNALHYAAYSGRLDIARLLIEHKADLDAPAPNGQTPLMLAAGAGFIDIVKLLVDSDADMDAEDPAGNTAISLAEKNGHADVVDYLRSEGAVE
ncbi:MAG TPA: ankyrin repeat domain-containing protein [Rhodocyclaceae bacterium]